MSIFIKHELTREKIHEHDTDTRIARSSFVKEDPRLVRRRKGMLRGGRRKKEERKKKKKEERKKKKKEKLVSCTCRTKEISVSIMRSKFYGINFWYDLPLIKIIFNKKCDNRRWKFNKQNLVINRLMKFTNRQVFYE